MERSASSLRQPRRNPESGADGVAITGRSDPVARSAPAASRRPEGQPVNHHTDAPRHQPQDPIDDGQWPGHDQEQDRDEAAVIAALADDDYLGTLPTHWSHQAEIDSGPVRVRRPLHPGVRYARAGHRWSRLRLEDRRAVSYTHL